VATTSGASRCAVVVPGQPVRWQFASRGKDLALVAAEVVLSLRDVVDLDCTPPPHLFAQLAMSPHGQVGVAYETILLLLVSTSCRGSFFFFLIFFERPRLFDFPVRIRWT
jgi:hypothetical protein